MRYFCFFRCRSSIRPDVRTAASSSAVLSLEPPLSGQADSRGQSAPPKAPAVPSTTTLPPKSPMTGTSATLVAAAPATVITTETAVVARSAPPQAANVLSTWTAEAGVGTGALRSPEDETRVGIAHMRARRLPLPSSLTTSPPLPPSNRPRGLPSAPEQKPVIAKDLLTVFLEEKQKRTKGPTHELPSVPETTAVAHPSATS